MMLFHDNPRRVGGGTLTFDVGLGAAGVWDGVSIELNEVDGEE
jgi:hypothetical protein